MAARGSEAEAVHGQYLLLQGTLPSPGVIPGQWHQLRLNASGTRISGFFNGQQLFSRNNIANGGIAATSSNGAPALASSFHEVLFDNLAVEPIAPPTNPMMSIVRAVSIAPGGVSSIAFSPECLVPAGCASKAEYSYESGLAIRVNQSATLGSLGRWRTSFSTQSHHLRLYNASNLAFQQNFKPTSVSNLTLLSSTSVDLGTCEPDDIGFCYSPLTPVPSLTLSPGTYFILSEERTVGDLVFWGRAMGTGGVRIAPMDAWIDQNEPQPESGNQGAIRLAGAVTIVNGSGTWLPDGTDRTCQDTASPVCNSTTNILCVSCTSSDWLAPSCPTDWNFQASCCATWTRQCAGNTPNLGFSAYGPVSALLAHHSDSDAKSDAKSDDASTVIKTDDLVPTDNGVQPSCSQLSAAAAVRLVSSMLHVLPTTSVADLPTQPLSLTLAAGESFSFQLVFTAGINSTSNIRVRTSTSDPKSVAFEPLRQVAFVRVSKATNSSRRPYGAGLYPDPLPPLKGSSGAAAPGEQEYTIAPAGCDHPPCLLVLWVELQALVPGARANVSIDISMDGASCRVQIPVRTRTFSVNTSFGSSTLLSGGQLELVYLRPNPFLLSAPDFHREARLAYVDAAVHGVNSNSFSEGIFPSIGINISEEDTQQSAVRLDTNAFDAMRSWAQHHLGWRRWALPLTGPLFAGKIDRTMEWKFGSPLGTSHFAAAGPVVVAQVFTNGTGPLEFSPRFLSLFVAVYGQIAHHLRSKGWLVHVSVMWHDEPDWADPTTLAIWLKIARLWKSHVAPELSLYQTFGTPAPDRVLRLLDQACVHVGVYRGGVNGGSGPRGVYAGLLANVSRTTGLELTTYSNELAVIDLPSGAIRMRTFPWMLWSTNFLINATAGGGLQGFTQTIINGIGHLSNIDANVSFENVDANAYPGRYNISGLWFMTYPSRLSGVQPPVPSIRWEMLRQGLQDVEQFALLNRLVRSGRQTCHKSGPAAAPICEAAENGWHSLQRIKKGVWDLSANFDFRETEYTHDTSVIDSILSLIGDACEQLLKLGANGNEDSRPVGAKLMTTDGTQDGMF